MPQDRIACERATYTFRRPGPPLEFLDLFRRFYGPTMNAFEAAEKNGRAEALHEELSRLFVSLNEAGDDQTVIPATYLKVTVTKP